MIIAFTYPSTSGKTTLIEVLKEYSNKRDYFTIVKLGQFIYPSGQRCNAEVLKTYKKLSRYHTPIVFIDGMNVFADGRSQRLVDLIVNIEYSSTEDTSPDFNTALSRRIKKSNTYKKSINSNKLYSKYME